ncbi:predicted protein [Naegleria gruberi]|uniref:Predicted protein n=1 Tax=Naegleria gruberi TaxID=5762 RepID=D2W0X0_NAEGR|nr:uncharacterized protein NAEGRDRAFT_75008 [Naegleria gruberi]EFC37216.1 predicted protein [Naegleria gruberi]|eukprot:XP_002669960.1 predicted protein [Naegleria gruberi strain NEG-M]
MNQHMSFISEEEFVFSCLDTDRVETVRTMLENGANPESEFNGSSALMVACFSGNSKVVRMLIQCGASLDRKNQEDEGVVFVAAKNNQDGLTPYQIASKLNHVECARTISDYMKSIY